MSDGVLTLPIDFGRKWLEWYIDGVQQFLSAGKLGATSTQGMLVSGCKKPSVVSIRERIIEHGNSIDIPLTETEVAMCFNFTQENAGREENRRAFREAYYNGGWKPNRQPERKIPQADLDNAKAALMKP